jgi:hypothetical protein
MFYPAWACRYNRRVQSLTGEYSFLIYWGYSDAHAYVAFFLGIWELVFNSEYYLRWIDRRITGYLDSAIVQGNSFEIGTYDFDTGADVLDAIITLVEIIDEIMKGAFYVLTHFTVIEPYTGNADNAERFNR